MKFDPIKKLLLLLLVLFFVPACQRHQIIKRKKITIVRHQGYEQSNNVVIPSSIASSNPPPITVFVHGTRMYPRVFVRPFFHCVSGFHRAGDLSKWFYYRRLAYELNKVDPSRFAFDMFYIYCWSGNLSFEAREQAAKVLYEHLISLVKNYQKTYGKKPFIRLIGHSHGCNVSLNLASLKKAGDDLQIDQLILLAGPVQAATMDLVQNSMFTKVYSLYSRADYVQILDPQGAYRYVKDHHLSAPLFSGRQFKLDPKVKQVKIKYNGRAPGHVEFIWPHLLRVIPSALDAMNDWPELSNPEENTEYLLKIITKKVNGF